MIRAPLGKRLLALEGNVSLRLEMNCVQTYRFSTKQLLPSKTRGPPKAAETGRENLMFGAHLCDGLRCMRWVLSPLQ